MDKGGTGAQRYLIYVFGEVAPETMATQILLVRREFIRGWDAAAEAERQLDILAYMRRFKTWDALYADLDRRAAETDRGLRNVTPPKPKQIEE